MTIAGKTVTPTVGNGQRSGERITLILMCAKTAALTVWQSLTHGAYYGTIGDPAITVGGYFDMYSSSLTYEEAYATLTLSFSATQSSLTVTISGSTKSDPVERIEAGSMDRPIEQHPAFRCIWKYTAWFLIPTSATSVSSSWNPSLDTNPAQIGNATAYIDGVATSVQYCWSKTRPSPPDADHYYYAYATPQRYYADSYRVPTPVITVTVYLAISKIVQSELGQVGKLKAPPHTYIYGNSNTQWLVTRSTAQPSGRQFAITTAYQYCADGWDTDIYEVAE